MYVLPFSLLVCLPPISSSSPLSPPSLLPPPTSSPYFLLSTESEELLSQVRSARTYHIDISPDLIHLVVATQDNHLLLVNLPDYFQVRGVGKGGREEGGREGGWLVGR